MFQGEIEGADTEDLHLAEVSNLTIEMDDSEL